MTEVSITDAVLQTFGRIGRAAVSAGRDPEAIELVAVSKRVTAHRIREAIEAGVRSLGENYVQEAEGKRYLVSGAEWRLIGRLQSNKAKRAAALFDSVDTLDRVEIVDALTRHRPAEMPRLRGLVQVWLGGSDRAGVEPAALEPLLEALLVRDDLMLEGLMGIPETPGDDTSARAAFARLRGLWERGRDMAKATGREEQWQILSMGMSADFELAIAEGSTMVRVGTAIFGRRA